MYMGRDGTVPYGAAHPSIFSTVLAPSSRSSIEEQLSSSKYEKNALHTFSSESMTGLAKLREVLFELLEVRETDPHRLPCP